MMNKIRGGRRATLAGGGVLVAFSSCRCQRRRGRRRLGAGPVIVLETVKGNIEFETYPEEAPKTVAQIVGLVKRNFYNGLRFHRAEFSLTRPGRRSDVAQHDDARLVGPGGQRQTYRGGRNHEEAAARARSGRHGLPRHRCQGRPIASSTSLTKPHPDFDGKYTVFGQVIKGMEVVDKIQVADILKRALVKEGAAKSLTRPFRSG